MPSTSRHFAATAYHVAVPQLLASTGAFALLRRWQRDKALILMYHGVTSLSRSSAPDAVNRNHVDVESFAAQLDFLRNHYEVTPLEEIIVRLRRGASVTGLAAVTLDDGYFNVYKYGAPVLLELGVPATVFLIAGLVGTDTLTWYDRVELTLRTAPAGKIECQGRVYELTGDRQHSIRVLKEYLKTLGPDVRDRAISDLSVKLTEYRAVPTDHFRLMNWSQVRELHGKGIGFGVHSYSHPNLSRVSREDLAREVDEAAQIVSSRLGVPIRELCFAYPDGDYNETVRDHVRTSGLLGAVAVRNALVEPGVDPFTVPRVAVSRGQSSAMFDDLTVGFTRHVKRLLAFPLTGQRAAESNPSHSTRGVFDG